MRTPFWKPLAFKHERKENRPQAGIIDICSISSYYMNMIVTRTIRIQLQPTPEQVALLRQTMQEYTASFNAVCKLADMQKTSNGVDLHKLTYAEQRASTHLPAQLICAARVNATEAIKSVLARRKKQVKIYQARLKKSQQTGKPIKPLRLAKTPHSQMCAIRYDARSFRFDRKSRLVSLVHVQQPRQVRNRATMAIKVPAYYEQYLTPQWQQESADLLYRKGAFWLHLVVSCAVSAIEPTDKTIGVDLGINRLAVTSHPRFLVASASKKPIIASSACVVRFRLKARKAPNGISKSCRAAWNGFGKMRTTW